MKKICITFILLFVVLGTIVNCFAQQNQDFSSVIIVPESSGVYDLQGSTLKLSAPVVSTPLYHHNTNLNNYNQPSNNNYANNSDSDNSDQANSDDSTNNDEYNNNMNQICADYFKNRAAQNYTTSPNYVSQRQIVDRQIMSFSYFAQSCENYYNNNKLIQNGLNSEQ